MDLDDGRANSGRERTPSLKDLVDVYQFPPKKWVSIRLHGDLYSQAGYWIQVKKKDGTKTKFPTPCPSYDPQAQERDSTIPDPWRDLQMAQLQSMSEEERKDQKKALVQYTQKWYMVGIVRSIQKQMPERLPKPTKKEIKTGFKDKDSDSLTANRVIPIGRSLLGKIQSLKGLNVVERDGGEVQAYGVSHPKFGRDLRVYFDPEKAPADQYQVQLGEKRTKLTDEEKEMLSWDLASATEQPEFDHEQIEKDFQQWATKMNVKSKKMKKVVEDDEDFDSEDEDEEEDEKPKKKKGKAAAKKATPKKKSMDEDDEDEDDFDSDDEDEDEDEEEDEKPKKKGKAAAKKATPKKKSMDEDDEDEDDFDSDDEDEDEDEDDEDEKPKKGNGKAAVKKGKPSKKSKDEDEDDDFDDDDDEDEKPKKKDKAAVKKVKSKKKSKHDEDEDEDDDFDDDDDEDEKPKKKGKATKKSKSDDDDDEDEKPKKKSKDEDEDDDDEDDDFDDDDDEDEDEKPKRKGKSAKAKPSKKKSKKSKSDDDDDDEDF